MSVGYSKNLVTTDEVKEHLKAHLLIEHDNRHSDFYLNIINGTELCQGDVFRVRKNLKRKFNSDFVLLMSNTCDMQPGRETNILAIPLRPLPSPDEVSKADKAKMASLYDNVTKYQNTTYFYLPPIKVKQPLAGIPGLFGAFGEMSPISSKEINSLFKTKPRDRILSLKETGYYILLIKLSVYFLRPDERYGIS